MCGQCTVGEKWKLSGRFKSYEKDSCQFAINMVSRYLQVVVQCGIAGSVDPPLAWRGGGIIFYTTDADSDSLSFITAIYYCAPILAPSDQFQAYFPDESSRSPCLGFLAPELYKEYFAGIPLDDTPATD